jgi:NAD(P)-dependent dehydrogenase (short-subunit alcohol dehydrogenase family)
MTAVESSTWVTGLRLPSRRANSLAESAGGQAQPLAGATQGLGLALVEGLADRMSAEDTAYLTGRNTQRIAEAMSSLPPARAQVRSELLDVTDADSCERVAANLDTRHGGVDVVFSNAVMRVNPGDDPADVVAEYVDVNNLGTTRVLRAFAPRLRDGGRLIVVASTLGTLHDLAPVLHSNFTDLATLDDVDAAVGEWRDAVQEGSAPSGAWPGFINIPSKIAQVAAVRTRSSHRRSRATRGRPQARRADRRHLPRNDRHRDVASVVRHERCAVPRTGGTGAPRSRAISR